MAAARAQKEISGHAQRGGLYAHGVAGEGYAGGYRDALYDVQLLLNDVVPKRRDYWTDLRVYQANKTMGG